MGIEFTLAGLLSFLSLCVAASSFYRARQRDVLGDTRHLEARIRALEDSMLRLDHYATLRAEMPRRLTGMEYRLAALDQAIQRLGAGREPSAEG